MRRILSLLIENESGALSRVAGLFSARGYNIETLTVAPTHDPSLSRMTIVSYGDDQIMEQITKQINKLIDIVQVLDISSSEHVEREMLLVKLRFDEHSQSALKRLVDIFRGRIVDVTKNSYIVELTGDSQKMDAFSRLLDERQLIEIVRSGVIGMGRGSKGIN